MSEIDALIVFRLHSMNVIWIKETKGCFVIQRTIYEWLGFIAVVNSPARLSRGFRYNNHARTPACWFGDGDRLDNTKVHILVQIFFYFLHPVQRHGDRPVNSYWLHAGVCDDWHGLPLHLWERLPHASVEWGGCIMVDDDPLQLFWWPPWQTC